MNTEFRNAKQTIRTALRDATREKVEEILEAARRGQVPFMFAAICLSTRLTGISHGDALLCPVAEAYMNLPIVCLGRSRVVGWLKADEALRQRILVSICKAELKLRDRETVRQLVESAEPTRRELAWVAPTMLVMLTALPRTAQAGYGPPNGNGKPEPPKPQAKRPWFFRWDVFQKVHRR